MSEVSDWALVFLTGALVLVTFALVRSTNGLGRHTKELVAVTKQSAEQAEANKIAPSLLYTVHTNLNADGHVTVVLRNNGLGLATKVEANEILKDGSKSPLEILPKVESVGIGDKCNIVLHNVKAGEVRHMEVTYCDIRGNNRQMLQRDIAIKQG